MPTPQPSDIQLGRHLNWVRAKLARLQPDYRFKWDIYFDRLEELARASTYFLDAGSGDNKTANELAGPKLCVGVDRQQERRPGIYVCADLQALPFRDAAFDLIGCRHVAEHLQIPDQVCAEWRRVLAPKGRILVQTVNRHSLLIRLARQFKGRWRERILIRRYGRRPEDHFPTYDRFNTPARFEYPPDGFRLASLTMTQDVDLQSKLGFWLSYFLVILTKRNPPKRSVITAEWQRLPQD